jgi:hypothetical protein
MIILITTKDERGRLITSHGVDMDTGRNVITSNDPPHTLGAVFDQDMGEWVLLGKEER